MSTHKLDQGGSGAVRAAFIRLAATVYELWMLLPLWLLGHYVPIVNVAAAGKWLSAAALLSLLGSVLSIRIHAKWKQMIAVVSMAAGTWGMLFITKQDLSSGSIIGFVVLAMGVMEGLTISSRNYRTGWYWTGVGVFFAVSAIFKLMRVGDEYLTTLTLGGIVCFAIALFAVNRSNLRRITLSESNPKRVPAALKRHNRAFVAVFFGGILLLAAALSGVLAGVLSKMTDTVHTFIKYVATLFPDGGEQPKPVRTPPRLTPEIQLPQPKETPWLFKELDLLLPYIAIALFIMIFIVSIYVLYRKGFGFWKKLFVQLAAFLRRREKAAVPEGYKDEQSSLFSLEEALGKLRDSTVGRLFAAKREPGWSEFPNNRERVRYLYRRWLRSEMHNGYPASFNRTPKETLIDARRWRQANKPARMNGDSADEARLVDVYYKARYGEEEPADEELGPISDRKGAR